LKYETLYKLAFENPAARYFLAAAPSLAEIVMLGKVWWHATQETERGRPRWDLVVLDAPATGHGLTFLTVPETFLRLVSEGPLALLKVPFLFERSFGAQAIDKVAHAIEGAL